jgi:N utilization substance protein A
VREVRLDEETGTATVIVSDFQLSLAIGKEGQNARLAARLTGWRIDIKSETQLAEEEAGYGGEEWAEGEWIEDEKGELVWKPAEGGEAMSASEWTHAAEDPAESAAAASEEVVVVTESADGSVTVEDVVVTETPDGEVIVDDVTVTESADGEVTVEEVEVVAKDGVVEEVAAVTEVSEEAEA